MSARQITRVRRRDRPAAALAAAAMGDADVASLRAAAAECRACGLWKRATQTVFGEGPVPARVMLVGEQPGDQEDRAGAPFVGPAGRIVDRALAEAGLSRDDVFVTNVVKHFKWRRAPRSGKRRLHERPNKAEIDACHPWVAAELILVKPDVLVLLGATAARALLERPVRINRERGQPLASLLAPLVLVTIHPSAALRAPDELARESAVAGLVADLQVAARYLDRGRRSVTSGRGRSAMSV